MKTDKEAVEQILLSYVDHLVNDFTITENYSFDRSEKMIEGYSPETISETRPEQKISFEFTMMKPTRSRMISDIKIFPF